MTRLVPCRVPLPRTSIPGSGVRWRERVWGGGGGGEEGRIGWRETGGGSESGGGGWGDAAGTGESVWRRWGRVGRGKSMSLFSPRSRGHRGECVEAMGKSGTGKVDVTFFSEVTAFSPSAFSPSAPSQFSPNAFSPSAFSPSA